MEKNRNEQQAALMAERVSEAATGKKPYEAPQILYRAPLEAMASVCSPPPDGVGKAFPGAGNCDEAFS
jgi:hypothetical protein